MSAATASIADVSKTDLTNKDDSRDRNKSGQSQAQCTPMPLPALGTQRIIQGNGTNVGTVISLQCPARHKLIGSELMCVMGTNSTHWVGETYCKRSIIMGEMKLPDVKLCFIILSMMSWLVNFVAK